jgi:transketolase
LLPLTWLPTAEFDRVRDGIADPHRRCRAFAAMSRINTLYMIAKVVRSGGPTVAIGAGPIILSQLLDAAPALDLTVVNLPWLNRIDPAWLAELIVDAESVVVVDNHYPRGAQADLVARALLEAGMPRLPLFLGIGLTELPVCGAPDETLDHHGLSANRRPPRP